jgi:hypothetical protein
MLAAAETSIHNKTSPKSPSLRFLYNHIIGALFWLFLLALHNSKMIGLNLKSCVAVGFTAGGSRRERIVF